MSGTEKATPAIARVLERDAGTDSDLVPELRSLLSRVAELEAVSDAAMELLNCHTGAPWQTPEIRNAAFRRLSAARLALGPAGKGGGA